MVWKYFDNIFVEITCDVFDELLIVIRDLSKMQCLNGLLLLDFVFLRLLLLHAVRSETQPLGVRLETLILGVVRVVFPLDFVVCGLPVARR